jgi:hypothetical protein
MGHHHAARNKEGRYTGLVVLKQMICYLYDMRRFPSAHLDYYMCYYRPGHKFTDRLYSGFAREKATPASCSLDLFTYIPYTRKGASSKLPEGWSLRACSASDLWEFERFYKHHSGGLLWKVLSLNHHPGEDSLEKAYARMGFIRRWQALALRDGNDLKAVIIAEESDVALNLSDLLNGFKVLVLDPNTPIEIIFNAVENIAKNDPAESFPLLIYPSDYAQTKGVYSEKQYLMWILDAQVSNEFVEYLGRKFRINFI